MKLRHVRRRVDANQPAIVEAYRRMGCSVLCISSVGHGAPDLVVGRGGVTDLVEVKDGSKPPSACAMTEAEAKFSREWLGSPVRIVYSIDDAAAHVWSMNHRAGA